MKCPNCGHKFAAAPKKRRKIEPIHCQTCGSGKHSDHRSYLRLVATQIYIRRTGRWPSEKGVDFVTNDPRFLQHVEDAQHAG